MLDYIYHTGHLAIDRELRHFVPNGAVGPRTEQADTLHDKALKALRACYAGKVELYQRRCGHGFEYHMRAIRGT